MADLGDKSNETLNALATTLEPDRCESCYGAETGDHKCCNTCAEVRQAYQKKGWAFTDIKGIIQCEREATNKQAFELNQRYANTLKGQMTNPFEES